MKQVFVVIYSEDYGVCNTLGVFSTLELAEEYVMKLLKRDGTKNYKRTVYGDFNVTYARNIDSYEISCHDVDVEENV